MSTPTEVFNSGAVRDNRAGKGRYDLISPFALKRLAMTMEEGAIKYGDRNWEKGMPQSRLFDSAIRHLLQYMMGYEDEDHLGHAMFNVMAMTHNDELIADGLLPYELDDRPFMENH